MKEMNESTTGQTKKSLPDLTPEALELFLLKKNCEVRYNAITKQVEISGMEEEDPELRRAITALVGPEAYGADGHLNRSAVAAWLFSDEEHLKAMNALVHPVVKRDFKAWCKRQTAETVVMESALLDEAGMRRQVDEVWEVRAPLETRIRRVMERDSCTREQVEAVLEHVVALGVSLPGLRVVGVQEAGVHHLQERSPARGRLPGGR